MFSNVVLYNFLELWIHIVNPNAYFLISENIILKTAIIRPRDKEINMLIPRYNINESCLLQAWYLYA